MKTLPVFKPLLFLLAVVALWLLWNETQAQPATSAPPTVAVEARAKTPEPAIWLTFGLDRIELLQHRPFADIPIWQFLASFIYIFLSFYISKFLDFFIRGQARRWASKTSTKVDDLLLDLVRGPIKIVAFVILLHIGMRVYEWPEVLADFFSKALKIIVACSITYVVIKAIDLIVGLWHQNHATPENEQFGKQLLPLIRKSLKVFVVIVAALVTSQNLGLNVTGLIASLSIGGLALGLAAQDTLSNLFGAVAILADKPFHVGDRILLDNIDGNVESIGFRSTRVRNQDGHLVTIPNKTMGNATITNVTRRPNIKTTMNIGITYSTSAEKVKRAAEILEEIFRPHPMTADLQIFFNRFDSSAMNIQVVHWWKSTDFKAYAAGIQELNLEVKRRFDAEDIDFAYPSQTFYLKRDPKSQLPASTENGRMPADRPQPTSQPAERG